MILQKVKLAIIIITYNSAPCIKKCISSVLKSALTDVITKVILIDNASNDSSRKILKKYDCYENFNLIFNNKNLGFAKSVNQGMFHARSTFDPDFFFLLNPDAYLDNNCLRRLLQHMKYNPKLGLVSPNIIDPNTNDTWFSGGNIDWLSFKTKHVNSALRYLSGCALLIKKEVYLKIGPFDENFFLYYEDADYGLRTRKAGFTLNTVTDSVCFHLESQSSDQGTKNYHLTKSALFFFHKHYPSWALPYFWTVFWARMFFHKYFSKKEVVYKGLTDFLLEYKK